MRRTTLIAVAAAALVVAAIGVVFVAKRTVRWNDARTMPPPRAAAVRAYAKGDSASGVRAVRLLAARYRAPAGYVDHQASQCFEFGALFRNGTGDDIDKVYVVAHLGNGGAG